MARVKLLFVVFMLVLCIGAFGQKPTTPKKVVKPQAVAAKVFLTDTAFVNLGVKFGYPKGYSVYIPANNPGYMNFYNADSSIILSVSNTSGLDLADIAEKWDSVSRIRQPDYWYRNIGKTPQKHYISKKPVYVSEYLYPFTFGGADYIWIQLFTTKPGAGIQQLEAVKSSVQLRPILLIRRNVIPLEFTMGVPSYLADDNIMKALSCYHSDRTWLTFKKSPWKGAISGMHMDAERKFRARFNFQEYGDISFQSPSGVVFSGFYGSEVELDTKFQVAYVFFMKPLDTETCYYLEFRQTKGISLNMGADLEEFLKTIVPL